MSLADALAHETVPERTAARPQHPAGWEPGIAWDGSSGMLTTAPLEAEPDPALWAELVADWGLDPNVTTIEPGSVQIRGWDANVGGGVIKRMRYYKATLRAREDVADRADVDALIAEIGKRKKRSNVATVADVDHALVVGLADWQIGKGEADGSAGSVDRIIGALDRLVDRLAEFKRLKRSPSVVYLLGLGDLVEGCSGHYCVDAETPILTRDLRWVHAGNLAEGDELYAFEEEAQSVRGRRFAPSTVLSNKVEQMEAVEVEFDDGSTLTCTPEHPLLACNQWKGTTRSQSKFEWMSAGDPRIIGMSVPRLFRPWETDRSRDGGYLAGMYDGEGSLSCGSQRGGPNILSISQLPGPVLEETKRIIDDAGFTYSNRPNKTSGVHTLRILGGYPEVIRMLGTVRPIRLIGKVGFPYMRAATWLRVVSVKPVGLRAIARLGTSTHTYIANGIPSHNSMQAFQTDLDRREQSRVVRRLILRYVDTIAALVPRVVCVAVPGNHGENRNASGKAYTTFTDNDDLAVFEQVAEILKANDERYGHVSVMLADGLSTAVDACGAVIGLAHMHQGRSGANPKQKVENWWKGHAMGRGAVGDADLLFTGHYHHLMISEALGRTWFQMPALDPGSAWYEEATGQHSPPGLFTVSVGECHGARKWDDMKVL